MWEQWAPTQSQKRGDAMSSQLPRDAAAYVRAVNSHDPAAFIALFADGAVVDDVGREFRGRDAIKAWSDREIFEARVTLEVVDITHRDRETVVATQVDGNVDCTCLQAATLYEHQLP